MKNFQLCFACWLCWPAWPSYCNTLILDDYGDEQFVQLHDNTQALSDGTVTFAFDYVAAGIPLAPRSAPGRSWCQFTVNDFSAPMTLRPHSTTRL